MYAKSPRIVQSANSYFQGSKCTSIISGVVWCYNGFHRIECKIRTPGMELFEQQYFTDIIILTRTEEGHETD